MSTITGTTAPDTLIGTDQADTLLPYGVGLNDPADYVSGGNGGDTYDLSAAIGTTPVHEYIIDDNGTDGALDTITGPGALFQSSSLGYSAYVTAERIGDDLHIVTPARPDRFHNPGTPSYDITIVDQYAGEQVEVMVAGVTSYALPTGSHGGIGADLMAGSALADQFFAGAGDDYIVSNGGDDRIAGGRGADVLIAGDGNDELRGQADNDWLYGGAGHDTVKAGSGDDVAYGEDGNDRIQAQKGNDLIYGQDGNDTLGGGDGLDTLSGGRGDDVLKGGAGGDVYRYGYDVDMFSTMTDAGHDVIRDKGEASTWDNFDSIELFGFYGPTTGSPADGYARLSFDRVGQDMVIGVDGGAGSITVKGQFGAGNTQIEQLHFNAGYWTPLEFQIVDGAKVNIGDDRHYASGHAGEVNEVLFGTDGNDQVFGNSGTNFIWLGAGSDTLIYKETDPQIYAGIGGGTGHDIVQDFNVTQDLMNFTQIAGTTMADLTVTDNAAGNATVFWDSGTIEVADIFIELIGVTSVELTADNFVF